MPMQPPHHERVKAAARWRRDHDQPERTLHAGTASARGKDAQDLLNKHISEKPVQPKHLNPEVTDDFNAFVMTMLAKKPEDRPRDFHEVLMKLRPMRVLKTTVAPRPPT